MRIFAVYCDKITIANIYYRMRPATGYLKERLRYIRKTMLKAQSTVPETDDEDIPLQDVVKV